MIVVDASTLLELFLRTSTGIGLEDRLFRKGQTLHAPALIDLEVCQVLRRYVSRGDIPSERGREAVELLRLFPMTRYAHDPLLDRIWALRENLTAYDAAYVALAEGLHASLITCDARLAGAPGIRVAIELVGPGAA